MKIMEAHKIKITILVLFNFLGTINFWEINKKRATKDKYLILLSNCIDQSVFVLLQRYEKTTLRCLIKIKL